MAAIVEGIRSAVQSVTGPADPNAEITRLEEELQAAKDKVVELEQKLKEARDKAAQVGLAVASSETGGRRKTRRSKRSRTGRKSNRS